MQLIRTIHSDKRNTTRSVATIGNFDGVHLGHQVVIDRINQQSKELNFPSMVIAFEPSAKEFFLQQDAPARLTTFREKFSLIKSFNINQLVCLKFNHALASMTAESFIKNILVDTLRIKHLTVGDKFRFGKDRKGDFELLKHYAEKLDYQVEDTESFVVDGKRVSSTSIRQHLSNGKLDKAKALLGRDYSMSGHVIHGDKKGRTIGFPTANVLVRRINCAVSGVFAVNILINGDEHHGVANIGHRPTIGGTRTQLEVHIFKFSKEIYGEFVEVTFCKKLRDEKKFDSFDDLKKQIQHDSQSARKHFSIVA